MDVTLFGLLPMLFGGTAADSPQALLNDIYLPSKAGQLENVKEHYSSRLRELVSSNLEQNIVDRSGQAIDPGAPGIVEFNPFLNGDDADLQGLTVTTPIIIDDAAVALVSFTTVDGSSVLSISMVRADEEWKVDDIASVGGGEKWLYSWLLRYDPFSQQ
jgi:hypothetical protein